MSVIVSSCVPARLRRNTPLPCRHFMPSRRGGARSNRARNICLKSGQKEGCFACRGLHYKDMSSKINWGNITALKGEQASQPLFPHILLLSQTHAQCLRCGVLWGFLWGGSRCSLQALCLLSRPGFSDHIPKRRSCLHGLLKSELNQNWPSKRDFEEWSCCTFIYDNTA